MRRSLECPWSCLSWCGLALALAACRATQAEVPVQLEPREMLERADRSFDTRAFGEALERYKLAAVAALEADDAQTLVEASAQAANVLALTGELLEGRTWLERAASQADAGDVGPWSRFLLARGMYEGADGDAASAEGTYRELYDYGLAHGRADRALQATYMATSVTSGEAQVAWARKGIDVARAAGEPEWEAEQWTNLGWLLDERGQFAEALPAFRRGHEIGAKFGGERGRIKADWVLAYGMRRAGHAGAARELLDRALAASRRRYRNLGRAPNDAEWIARCESELAELDAAAGDIRAALKRLTTASRFFQEAGAEIHAPESYARLEARMRELREAELHPD